MTVRRDAAHAETAHLTTQDDELWNRSVAKFWKARNRLGRLPARWALGWTVVDRRCLTWRGSMREIHRASRVASM